MTTFRRSVAAPAREPPDVARAEHTPRSRRALVRTAFAAALAMAAVGNVAHGETATSSATAAADPDNALVVRASDIAYKRELDRVNATPMPNADRSALSRARRIADRLLSQLRGVVQHPAPHPWAINLDRRAEPMLWSLPTGQMMISTGLVQGLGLSDPELAAVLAHVIAHTIAGDENRAAAAAYRSARFAPDPDFNRAALEFATVLAAQMTTPHHEPAEELAADALAIELMAHSVYDPAAAIAAWNKIADPGKASASAFAALHPMTQRRQDNLGHLIAAAVPTYETKLAEAQAAAAAAEQKRQEKAEKAKADAAAAKAKARPPTPVVPRPKPSPPPAF